MSTNKDVLQMARAGFRNLYLQIVDFYTESIDLSQISPNLIKYFDDEIPANADGPGMPMFPLLKTETSIQDFINRMIELRPGDSENSFENMTKYLTFRYDFFGIETPPEGFLQVYYDVKSWWKFRTRLQNGYFIFTEVFNYNEKQISKSNFNGGAPYFFDPTSKDTIIADDLKKYLIEETKNQYLIYANQNSFTKIVAKDQMKKEYFFFLDEGKNSIKFVSSANGKSGKVYIRTFFNEFGQKLDASLVEVQGVGELKKIPQGIRKNYIVKNLFSGIDAFEKDQTKDGPPVPRTLEIINHFKEVKKLLKKSIKEGQIYKDSRIGFIFSDDYEFLSAVNSENKLINNFELYRFLKDKKETNKYIARLNAINCRLVGSPQGPPTSNISIPFGFNLGNYEHFGSGDMSATPQTPEEKAIRYHI